MAKNLFEQLLTKAGEIWSGPKTQDDRHIYIQDSSGLSGVAKYLAKQEQAAQVEQTAAPVSGVEKYLARQQASSPKAATETPTTGVGKYLARQSSSSTSAQRKEPVVVPKTGVGKYLAGVSIADAPKAKPVAEKKQAPAKKAETIKAPAPAKAKPVAATAPKTPEPASEKPAATSASAPAGGIIKFENISQCHASTVKGTQCKNTTNLVKIQRTVNKKKYQFCACTQHNNDTFKPYQPLLEM
jgi:hypothetical protein